MRASFKKRQIFTAVIDTQTNEFVDKVCAMEGAAAGLPFASGMAAVYSTLWLL
jgi:O-succinylhomoserine sulfhydrylase